MNRTRLKIFNVLHPSKKAYDYQLDWGQDENKWKLAVKARQIGITTTEAIKQFINCVLWKPTEKNPLPPVVIFCSPSQRQSSRLMHYIQRSRNIFEKELGTDVVLRKEREDFVCFDNWSEIWSLPNNPRTIEGIDASQGVIDEAANFTGREDEEVYEAMLGSLAAKAGGMTLFSRPRGRRGLLWRLADPYGDYVGQYNIHLFPYTIRAAQDERYEKAVLDQKSKLLPLAFREQYECEFLDETVVLFTYGLLDLQSKDYKLDSLSSFKGASNPLYMGVDFARKIDETAVSIVSHGQTETRLLFHETTTKEFDKQVTWIGEIIEIFKPVKCFVDETGQGLPMLDILKSRFSSKVEGVIFSNPTKEKLILNLRNLFEEGRLFIPKTEKELIEQLHGIEKEVLDSGKVKYTGKRTETDWLDDRVWSLSLACHQLGEGNFEMTIVKPRHSEPVSQYDQWMRDTDEEGNPL